MQSVNVSIGKDRYRTSVQTGRHRLTADEPVDAGGKDEGPAASELLLAGLGACTAITLRMYADRKAWPLDGVGVELSLKRETTKEGLVTHIGRRIRLDGALDEEQRKRLLEIAGKCPVHRTLTSPVTIETTAV